MAKILVVEDESIIAADIRDHLRELGYEVCSPAASGEQALERAEREGPDLILMDIVLQGSIFTRQKWSGSARDCSKNRKG